MKRHPEISVRKPEKVSSAAATVTEVSIRKWFQSVRELLVEDGYHEILEDAQRVFNGDEIGFCLDPETKAVLIAKKEKKRLSYRYRLKEKHHCFEYVRCSRNSSSSLRHSTVSANSYEHCAKFSRRLGSWKIRQWMDDDRDIYGLY